jgi:hypothetical protein
LIWERNAKIQFFIKISGTFWGSFHGFHGQKSKKKIEKTIFFDFKKRVTFFQKKLGIKKIFWVAVSMSVFFLGKTY